MKQPKNLLFTKKLKNDFEKDRLKLVIKKYKLKDFIKTESPDCIVKLDQETIGIELISYKESIKEAREILIFEICNLIKSQYIVKSNIPVSVVLNFNSSLNLKNNKTSQLVESLVDIILNYNQSGIMLDFLYKDYPKIKKILPATFEYIEIKPSNAITISPINIDEIESLNVELLQSLIDKKNNRIHSYKNNANKLWLVVDIGNYSSSTFFDLDYSILKYNYSSRFDKTILLWDKYIYELITKYK